MLLVVVVVATTICCVGSVGSSYSRVVVAWVSARQSQCVMSERQYASVSFSDKSMQNRLAAPLALLLALLLALATPSTAAVDMDMAEFASEAPIICRCFIFDHYERFRASELTFKHLKQHLQKKLGVSMEFLKGEDASSIIEDTTDEIANVCKMGEVSIRKCKKKVQFDDDDCAMYRDDSKDEM